MEKRIGLPKWSELVLCTVTRITPFAAWCSLDEYEKKDGSAVEGMIHVSQVAGRWVKDIRKFVKPNKQYVAKVIYIDYQKEHLNLSLKRVSKVDKREKMESFKREKRATGMLAQIAKRVGSTGNDVRNELESKLGEQFDDVFDVFEKINDDPVILNELDISKQLKDALQDVIERNFRVKEKTVKAVMEITTTGADGVEILKKVLSELEKETGAKVKYISAPKYQIGLKTKQPKAAEKKLRSGIESALEKIKSNQGEGSYEFVK